MTGDPAMSRFLAHALLVGVGCLAALAAAEIVVRLADPSSRAHAVPAGLLEMDSDLGWRLAAGVRVRHRTPSFDVFYETNSLGFRDRPARQRSGIGTRQILVCGDSFVFGWGVPREQRFTDLLREALPGFEVRNLGVPGYGLDQQLLALDRSTLVDPGDVVVLLVSEATLMRCHRDAIYRKRKPRFVLGDDGRLRLREIPAASAAGTDLLYRLLSPLALPYFVERRLLGVRYTGPRRGQSRGPSTLDPLETAVLERARRWTRSRGARLVLLADLLEGRATTLESLCRSRDIGCVPVVIDRSDPELVLGSADPHWSARANEHVAAVLADALEAGDRGALDPTSAPIPEAKPPNSLLHQSPFLTDP
jgi:hypothetical protein